MADERFIGGWTRASLAARTPAERHAIWKRARMLRTADGNQLAREIERLGLPYEEADPWAEDHPTRGAMAEIIESPTGRSACIEATLDGLPAIAGVDPLLHEAFGRDYRHSDQAVATAQALVAQAHEPAGLCASRRQGASVPLHRPLGRVLEAKAGRLTDTSPTKGGLRSFGRIKARPIKPRQAALLDSLLPRIAIADGAVLPAALMGDAAEVWLEIGFGGGEHMAAQAQRRPDALILGAEPFLNGVASALRHIDEAGLNNIRLRQGDARQLLADLPTASVTRVFILFPDPWPKTRHHKRRLIQAETIAELARVLTPGGGLRFATDWSDYASWTLDRMIKFPAFRWSAECAEDWRNPPADHVSTRYEHKRLGDCAPIFLDFERTQTP